VSEGVVSEERERGGVSAAAEVRAEQPGEETRKLAGAVAYARVGRRLLAGGAVEAAIEAAQAGLDEVGRAPFSPELADDTELKLHAAADRRAEGHAADAAEVMLDILEIRTGLHARAQSATIVT